MDTAIASQGRRYDRWETTALHLRKCGAESVQALLRILESPRQYRWQRSRHAGPVDIRSFDKMLAEERAGRA